MNFFNLAYPVILLSCAKRKRRIDVLKFTVIIFLNAGQRSEYLLNLFLYKD